MLVRACSLGAALAWLLVSAVANADQTVFVDFNDGSHLSPIGSFYSSNSLTMDNGLWSLFAGGLEGASPPLGVQAIDSGSPFISVFDEAHAVIGIFVAPVSRVSIVASDVGLAGARLKVYDAISAGTLLGTDTITGMDAGVGNFGTLEVSAVGIRRFEIFQPFPNPGSADGVGFDDLSFDIAFTPVPALWLPVYWTLAVTLGVLGIRRLTTRCS